MAVQVQIAPGGFPPAMMSDREDTMSWGSGPHTPDASSEEFHDIEPIITSDLAGFTFREEPKSKTNWLSSHLSSVEQRPVTLPFQPATGPEIQSRVPSARNARAVWFFRQLAKSAEDPKGAYIGNSMFIPKDMWEHPLLPDRIIRLLALRIDAINQVTYHRLRGFDVDTVRKLTKVVQNAYKQHLLSVGPATSAAESSVASSKETKKSRSFFGLGSKTKNMLSPKSSSVSTEGGSSPKRQSLGRRVSMQSLSSTNSDSSSGYFSKPSVYQRQPITAPGERYAASPSILAKYVQAIKDLAEGLEKEGYSGDGAGRYVMFVVESLADNIVDDVFTVQHIYMQTLYSALLS